MPKVPKNTHNSALKKVRRTFLKNSVSDSEESCESEASEEYSHIPLRIELPSFDCMDIRSEEEMMAQLNTQMNELMQGLRGILEHQKMQDDKLNELSNKIDFNPDGGNSSSDPPPSIAPSGGLFENLFRIPDPIKSLPTYDGNRRQLAAWLATAKDTLDTLEPLVTPTQYKMYVRAVLNKIEGKAKDVLCLAGNPQDFDDVSELLTNAIGDRQELSTYMSQIWQNKMNETTSIHKYYQKAKELVQNIKILSKQKEKYKQNWDAICTFIDEFALAAFIAGLRDPYFGHVQAARPKDIEDAYAFLCKFRSQQITASRTENMDKKQNGPNKSKSFNNMPKPNDEKPTNKFLQHQKTHPIENADSMELDPSQRSKLTLNRKIINNNEIESESDGSKSDEEDSVAINFCLVRNQETET